MRNVNTGIIEAGLVNTYNCSSCSYNQPHTVTPGDSYVIEVLLYILDPYGVAIDNVEVTEQATSTSYAFRLEDGNQSVFYYSQVEMYYL